MQSKNGGYGAFDVDNTYYYLDEIPFADTELYWILPRRMSVRVVPC